MGAFGILNLVATVLELCVPSYALRLVRRFGAQQAGSFVIIAFASLALLHLINPPKSVPGSSLALSLVYGIGSLLLLIGMGHTETLCRERQHAQEAEEKLRSQLDLEAREKAESLLQIRQEMAQEIVKLQQQVETLGTAERQYRFLFLQHPHPMWVFDLRTGRILMGNQAALAQYGFSEQEFSKLSAKDLLSREAAQAFVADAAKPWSSLEQRGIWRHRRKDHTALDVEVMGMDLRFADCPARLVFTQDIAPRVAREAALVQDQKMSVLRRVIEGMAHHFGHILTVVEGQTVLLRAPREDGAGNEHLEQVLAETRRGNALIRQLLAVAACESIQPGPVDVSAFVLKEAALLRRVIGEAITLEFHLAEDLMPALADTRVLEHVLVNLVLNAREALPQGGAIEIHTEAAWVDAQQNRPAPHVSPGQYIHLTVHDNGAGMPPEIHEHIFEPFFTTREHEHAMGLGLAAIYGAIKQHGGWVEFASQPRRGTELSVFLPIAQPIPQANTVPEPALPPPVRETILFVEANDQVRDLARHILQRDGYKVIEADSPSTAMLLMESQASKVRLLVTDLSFPDGSSGCDLAGQLRQVNPEIDVVYATVPLTGEDTQTALLQQAQLLLKPYTPDQLLQRVGLALGQQPAQRS